MDSGSVRLRCMSKPLKRQKSNQGQDIISNLPDFIIGRILSFLPTKDAVRTSVLSKRWEYLWTFITKLHIDDSVHYSSKKTPKKNFVNFVNRVLFHLNNLSIQSFSLVISSLYDANLVNSWISAILNRRVQKLSVCFYSPERLTLPFRSRFTLSLRSRFTLSFRSLFNCESLEELVLKMSRCNIRVLSSVYLPYLKILNLSGTTFFYRSSSKLKELNFSFPVLKKFEAKDFSWYCPGGVTFTVPLLERVTIENPRSGYHFFSQDCAIKFSASHLTEFTYRGQMRQDIILLDPSSARNSSISLILNCEERDQETGLHACMLLRQFSQVESLKLDETEVLEQAIESFVDLPTFEMLRHLEILSVNVEILLGLLLKSPLLKTLVLEDICEFDKELLNSAILPDCLISTLKVIKFGKLNGYEHELCLASFLMENAVVLERMHFSPARCLYESDLAMEEIKQKLFSFKKGFAFAIIEIS